ncbi:MAG TPA: hypothetical protein ENI89_08720 [Desulfobulbus sp.]|nr:hypothetical protein [Desulfobulbus sp.]
MPIAGVVITTRPDDLEATLQALAGFKALEVHASDAEGNIVAVLDTGSLDAMEGLVREINGVRTILSVGLTYLNAEDEIERPGSGERLFGLRSHQEQ